jgi:succinate dehydrogenase / fumarate reductase membrane anchor subunit
VSLKSPLGRVLGLGASGGSHHWWLQRLSSVALVPLGAWFAVALLGLPDLSYGTAHAWLARPVNAVLMLLLIPVAVRHSMLGVQVVLEDYVQAAGARVASLVTVQFLHVAVGVAAVFAVLRVALAGFA